jgi:hypothetical protein
MRAPRSAAAPKPAPPPPRATGGPAPVYRYSDGNVELVTPDVSKWQCIKAGMPRDEVRKLLGPAIEEGGGRKEAEEEFLKQLSAAGFSPTVAAALWKERSEAVIYVESWRYGGLKFSAPIVPIDDGFYVHFDGEKVMSVFDPFDGRMSLDGRPTTPVLAIPYDHSTFNHLPFLVDVRWLPSCGEYPIEYLVELTYGDETYDDRTERIAVEWHDERPRTQSVTIPYATVIPPGANPCRLRVKAKNRLGESAWSEYRHFQFG